MAAPYSNLLSKCEQALAAYLATKLPAGSNIFTGKDSDDKATSATRCECPTEGDEDPPYSGNKWVDASVFNYSIAAIDADGIPTKPSDETLNQLVGDALAADDLAVLLSALVTDFTVQGFTRAGGGEGVTGDCWETEHKLRLYCCAADL